MSSRRLGPQSVHLGADADGADHRAGRRFDGFDLLDDVFKGGMEIRFTPGGEASGMGVTVDGRVVAEVELSDDAAGGAPAEIGFFDVFAIRAVADTALASVA